MLATKTQESIKGEKDRVLVEKTRQGIHWAFAELVRRHRKPLMNFIFQMTRDMILTEDIIQESLLKAYTKIHLFKGQSTFKSWLFRIAVNTAKNRFRKNSRQVPVDIDSIQLTVVSSIEEDLYKDILRKNLKKEIEKLPEKQRMALSLRIFSDLSFKEIAHIMKSPYDTAKANYRHAIQRIKKTIHSKDLYQEWEEDFEDPSERFKVNF